MRRDPKDNPNINVRRAKGRTAIVFGFAFLVAAEARADVLVLSDTEMDQVTAGLAVRAETHASISFIGAGFTYDFSQSSASVTENGKQTYAASFAVAVSYGGEANATTDSVAGADYVTSSAVATTAGGSRNFTGATTIVGGVSGESEATSLAFSTGASDGGSMTTATLGAAAFSDRPITVAATAPLTAFATRDFVGFTMVTGSGGRLHMGSVAHVFGGSTIAVAGRPLR